VSQDPHSADSDRWEEPALRLPWLVAPMVAALVVLIVVGLAAVLWPKETPLAPLRALPATSDAAAGGHLSSTGSVSASPSGSSTSRAAPTTQASSGALPTPSVPVIAPRPSTRHRPTPTWKPSPTTSLCRHWGVVDVTSVYNGGWVTVSARVDGQAEDQLCPGERIQVFWATYDADADGVSHLYASQSYWLDDQHPVVKMFVDTPPLCGASWYVVRGDEAAPETFAKGASPFGDNKFHWSDPVIDPSCTN
jgi:hypothetical protein